MFGPLNNSPGFTRACLGWTFGSSVYRDRYMRCLTIAPPIWGSVLLPPPSEAFCCLPQCYTAIQHKNRMLVRRLRVALPEEPQRWNYFQLLPKKWAWFYDEFHRKFGVKCPDSSASTPVCLYQTLQCCWLFIYVSILLWPDVSVSVCPSTADE